MSPPNTKTKSNPWHVGPRFKSPNFLCVVLFMMAVAVGVVAAATFFWPCTPDPAIEPPQFQQRFTSSTSPPTPATQLSLGGEAPRFFCAFGPPPRTTNFLTCSIFLSRDTRTSSPRSRIQRRSDSGSMKPFILEDRKCSPALT